MVFDLVLVNQDMSPEVVAQISLRLGIPRNFMFISCPPEVNSCSSPWSCKLIAVTERRAGHCGVRRPSNHNALRGQQDVMDYSCSFKNCLENNAKKLKYTILSLIRMLLPDVKASREDVRILRILLLCSPI